jgi:formiminotetrahydrofolate cyclodeaminase
MTSARAPSLKLGTHSTSEVEEDVRPLPLTIMLSETVLNHSPSDSILDLSVRELLERLGSSAPAPGGGAAAALAGALGAALVQMTANLSIGRPRLADIEAQARQIEAQAADLRRKLGELGDADAQAYARVSAAYKLPRQPLAQDTERSLAIQAALHEAAAVPLDTARLCAAVLELAEAAAPLLNPAVISDVMVGAVLAQAALESAALNVDVNLAAMTDAGTVARLQRELDQARDGAAERLQRILVTARSRLSKPVSKR